MDMNGACKIFTCRDFSSTVVAHTTCQYDGLVFIYSGILMLSLSYVFMHSALF